MVDRTWDGRTAHGRAGCSGSVGMTTGKAHDTGHMDARTLSDNDCDYTYSQLR